MGEGLPGYLLNVNPSPFSLPGAFLDGLLVIAVGLVLAAAVLAVAVADTLRGRR